MKQQKVIVKVFSQVDPKIFNMGEIVKTGGKCFQGEILVEDLKPYHTILINDWFYLVESVTIGE